MNIRKVAAILCVIAVSNFLIYHFLYAYEERIPIYQSIARERHIDQLEDAKQVIEAEKSGGAIILKDDYYVVNRRNETHPDWWVEWWEYQGFYIEQRFPYRENAFWLWGLEIFALIFFAVIRPMRQPSKSVSMNS